MTHPSPTQQRLLDDLESVRLTIATGGIVTRETYTYELLVNAIKTLEKMSADVVQVPQESVSQVMSPEEFAESLSRLCVFYDKQSGSRYFSEENAVNYIKQRDEAIRNVVLEEAIYAIKGEFLCDNTGDPEDIGYSRGLSDAIDAIRALKSSSREQGK